MQIEMYRKNPEIGRLEAAGWDSVDRAKLLYPFISGEQMRVWIPWFPIHVHVNPNKSQATEFFVGLMNAPDEVIKAIGEAYDVEFDGWEIQTPATQSSKYGLLVGVAKGFRFKVAEWSEIPRTFE